MANTRGVVGSSLWRCSIMYFTAFAATVGLGWLVGCNGNGDFPNSMDELINMAGPPSPAEAATMAADPYSADNRTKGMLLLANAPWGGEPVYIRLYEVALDDEDLGVQAVAVRALSFHGSPEHVPAIADKLDSSDDNLRWEAARALQRLHNPVAVGPLLDHTARDNEENADVRAAAATALSQYPEQRVFDSLVAALDDPSLRMNRAAADALTTLTGQRLGADPRPWFAWADETDDLFASREVFEYPVFRRDRRVAEYIVPWLEPPNETSSIPVGMPAPARRADEPAEDEGTAAASLNDD
jgi:hypothetical protein